MIQKESVLAGRVRRGRGGSGVVVITVVARFEGCIVGNGIFKAEAQA